MRNRDAKSRCDCDANANLSHRIASHSQNAKIAMRIYIPGFERLSRIHTFLSAKGEHAITWGVLLWRFYHLSRELCEKLSVFSLDYIFPFPNYSLFKSQKTIEQNVSPISFKPMSATEDECLKKLQEIIPEHIFTKLRGLDAVDFENEQKTILAAMMYIKDLEQQVDTMYV